YLNRLCHADLLTLEGHDDRVVGLSFSADGRLLASAGADGTVIVRDLSTGKEIRTITGPGSRAFSVALSPDGRYVAVAAAVPGARVLFSSREPRVVVWEVASGQELYRLDNPLHYGRVLFSPDSCHLATAHPGGTAEIWDAPTGRPVQQLKGPANPGTDVAQD